MIRKLHLPMLAIALLALVAAGCAAPAQFATVRHQIADDFVLVCPVEEVLDPSHPCADRGASAPAAADDYVLVCPTREVLDPSHPCHGRAPRSPVDDFVLVCPIEEVLDPSHPCAE